MHQRETLATPIWSLLGSMSGKARLSVIRCRSLTRSSCSAAARSSWCPPSRSLASFARTAVAWDGSREAVRSIHDALPLLSLSKSVDIVTIIPRSAEEDEADATSLSAHLSRHGIKVGPKVLRIRTSDEGRALQNEVNQGRYDLLVMGGYSHAMWFEFIFGGATQSVLLSSEIPILVSH